MMTIQENISLQPYNTFGVATNTHFFTEIANVDDLKSALTFVKEKELPLLLLGGGSNILLTKDFEGLAIKLSLKGISTQENDENSVLVTAEAGENWHQFVLWCLDHQYGGLENLSLIPGNVGTSPMQNIGAYGTEIKDTFFECTALNIETFNIETFNKEQCQFGYRESFFKREGKNKYVILNVTFQLTTQHHKTSVEYGAIQSELEEMGISTPTIQDISNAVIRIRQSKLPDPKLIGNAGSFFKNPVIPTSLYETLKQKFENMPAYPNGEFTKVPAGWLIEHSGWKGKQIGNVASHAKQALVIINATGEASGQEIFDFSTQIIDSVKSQYSIELEREVNII